MYERSAVGAARSSLRRRPSIGAVVVALWVFGVASAGAQDGQAADHAPPADRAALEVEAEEALGRVEGLRDAAVEIHGGAVTITGEAVDSGVRELAEETVRSVTGLEAVANEIELSGDVEERLRGAAGRLGRRFDAWASYLPLIPVAAAIVLLAFVAAWLAGRWRWLFRRLTPNPFLQDIVRRVAQAAIMLAGVLAALEVLDAVALVGGVLGAAGVVGIAIGFAFRDLVENYIASILLSVRQPFRPRDHVLIEGSEGLVTRLTTRSTVLTTFDGNVVRIPNATVFKAKIVNYTANPERRLEFGFNIGYGADLGQARATAVRVLRETEGVMADPEPFAQVTDLMITGVAIRVFAWVDQRRHDFGRVRSLAMQRVKEEFEREGVEIIQPVARADPRRVTPPETGAAINVGPSPARPGTPAGGAAAAAQPGVDRVAADDTIRDLADVNSRKGDGEDLLSEKAERE